MRARSVLLVRHGPGLGRLGQFGNSWLERLAHTRPKLRRRIRVHETGQGDVPVLDDVAAIVFLLADPLRELYLACYAEAAAIHAGASRRGIRCVNPPDALSNTIKSVQARIWEQRAIPAASVQEFRDREELDQLAATASYPVIVRPDRLHAQQKTFVCRSAADVKALDNKQVVYPGLAVEFVDSRATYRAAGSGSVFARYYHRCRTYVFGRHVVPGAIYFSDDPIVGTGTATWARYEGLGRCLEPLAWLLPEQRRIVAADLAFAASPAREPDLMRRAAGALGLEFAALDHILLADGSTFFWEANPHPYIASFRHTPLPFLRRIRSRNGQIYDAIGNFLADLLDEEADAENCGDAECARQDSNLGPTA